MYENNLIIAIDENLKNRDNDRIGSGFKTHPEYTIKFINHSSDEGVIRNGGRRGSAYAPLALINCFKKMALVKEHYFQTTEVANIDLERKNFELAKASETQNIIDALSQKHHKSQNFVFLGGGHDHVYNDLLAIEKANPQKKIIVVNLDPHLDMRPDAFFNSGTPFRQFDSTASFKHQLIQIGTHEFANAKNSLTTPRNIEQKIISFEAVLKQTENFQKCREFFSLYFPKMNDAIYFFSLDVDAIDSSIMEAVSAVNHRGLPANFIEVAIDYFKSDLNCQYFGFYEYNPVYDNLSQKGARFLASLFYRLI